MIIIIIIVNYVLYSYLSWLKFLRTPSITCHSSSPEKSLSLFAYFAQFFTTFIDRIISFSMRIYFQRKLLNYYSCNCNKFVACGLPTM